MELTSDFGAYALVTIFSLPIEALIALPWIIAAWLVSRWLRGKLSSSLRILLITILLAAGLAPVYGHSSMLPIYVFVLVGKADPVYSIYSFIITWVVVMLGALVTVWIRKQLTSDTSNKRVG